LPGRLLPPPLLPMPPLPTVVTVLLAEKLATCVPFDQVPPSYQPFQLSV
jgi:hypothetical protein